MPQDDGLALAAQMLRDARKEAGLTVVQLAQRLGVTKGYVSRVETDKEMPAVPRLVQWLREVGLTNGELALFLNMRMTGALHRLKTALEHEQSGISSFCLEDWGLREQPAGTNARGEPWVSQSAKPSGARKTRRRDPYVQ